MKEIYFLTQFYSISLSLVNLNTNVWPTNTALFGLSDKKEPDCSFKNWCFNKENFFLLSFISITLLLNLDQRHYAKICPNETAHK